MSAGTRATAVLIVAIFATSLFAQQAALSPSAAQHRKLVSERAKLAKLQGKISDLQVEFSFLASQLQENCRRIAIDNHWPADVQCDPVSLMFFQPHTPASIQNQAPQNQAPAGPVSAQTPKPEEKPKP